MTRTEERTMLINRVENHYESKEENGVKFYLDPQYNKYFTLEQIIRTFDIMYEEIGNAYETITDMTFDIAFSNDVAKLNFQVDMSKKVINRMLEEGIINNEVYEEALKKLMKAYNMNFENL